MEKHVTKGWVIKTIIWTIVACIMGVGAWLAWVFDVPQKVKCWFLKLINRH